MPSEILCSDLSGVLLLGSWNGHKELQRDVTKAGKGSVCHQIMSTTELWIKGKYCVLLSVVSFVQLMKWTSGLEDLQSVSSSASDLEFSFW